jgi:RimJ/RimL family protein N-acetyltransferase
VPLTARLALPPLTLADARAILRGERAGRSWAAGYPTAGDVEIARVLARDPPRDERAVRFGPRRIELRAGGAVVGGIGFLGPPDADGAVLVGYGVAAEHRGRGIAGEALGAMLALARADGGVRRVAGHAAADNLASRRVLEKAGFHLAGERDGLVLYELVLDA